MAGVFKAVGCLDSDGTGEKHTSGLPNVFSIKVSKISNSSK